MERHHIKYAENKISKNVGILYKTRNYLSKGSLVTMSIFTQCLHSHIRKLCQFSMDKYDKNKLKKNA